MVGRSFVMTTRDAPGYDFFFQLSTDRSSFLCRIFPGGEGLAFVALSDESDRSERPGISPRKGVALIQRNSGVEKKVDREPT